MRRVVLPVLACCLICFAEADRAFSKGGPGRGGGGGGGNGGGRAATQSGNRGGGGRPTLNTQNRGGGNRPTLNTQNRGNSDRPTVDREPRGGGNRPSGTGRPDQDAGTTTRNGQGRPQGSDVATQSDSTDSTARLTGRENALNVQRRNEDRKLAHRQQIADQLRTNADRNGNENLYDTADRMEQRAYEQYERRLSRINGDLPDNGLTDNLGDGLADDLGDGLADDLAGIGDSGAGEQLLESAGDRLADTGEVAEALDGDVDSFARRLANEDRKLQHQLDVAQQLRDIAARNGNENLIQTAERMEDMAYTRYDRQLEKFLNPVTDPETVITDPLGGPTIADPLIDGLDVTTP